MKMFGNLILRQTLLPSPSRLTNISLLFGILVLLATAFSACTTTKRSPPPLEDEQDKFKPVSETLKVDFYFDATLSMKGFVSTSNTSSYQQTIPLLERGVIEGWNGGQATFYKFGDSIASLPGREYLEAGKPAFYGDNKYNRKTLIERVIEQAIPDHLTVIITDLFQSNADVNQLSDKLKQKFIANNLAIGVYAIRSEYQGTVYDVGADGYSFPYRSGDKAETHRPFYLLAFGSHADIAHYFDVLDSSGLNTFAEKHALIFSRHLTTQPASFAKAKLKTSEKLSEISSSNLLSGDYKGERVKAFKINKGTALARFGLELPYDAMLSNVLVYGNELVSEVTAWKGEDKGAKELVLVENPQAQKALYITTKLLPEQAPFQKLELKGEINAGELPAAGIYRYRVLLRPKSYALPEWIKKWNMRDDEIKVWHQRPQDFNGSKTYNLENFLGTLQGAVLSTTPPKICDVYFYVRVDK